MRVPVLATALLGFTACGSDHGVSSLCGTPQQGFDITEASELQDAQGYPGMHDAVILDFDDASLSAEEVWRVRSVEIMPMIGVSEYDWFTDGQQVSVEVWDRDNPLTTTPWKVTQTFRKDEHDWETVTLSDPNQALEAQQFQSWWRFGFEDVIPTEGMTDGRYLVSVVWEGEGRPTLGYSNFNRSCDLNWTDYGDGFGWVLNEGDSCSWPMLRVNMEVLEEAYECEGESTTYE